MPVHCLNYLTKPAMKNILVLTDFTENAAHAAKSAVLFAGALNTNLLLHNTLTALPVSSYYSDYAGGPWIADDFTERQDENQEKLSNLAESLEQAIAKLPPELHKPVVRCESREGNLGESVAAIIEEKNVELIVMGASSEGTFEHVVNGSDTRSIIKHATRPVLVIPQNSVMKKLRKVIFATDFDEADMIGLRYLVKLAKLFTFEIEVVHVSIIGKTDFSALEREVSFLKQVNKLKFRDIIFKETRGKDVVGRLSDICNEDKADILALVHYQHSLLGRILISSTTKKALSKQQIPLLIFPSSMEDE